MPETPAQRALAASTLALLVALGCIVLVLPPLADRVVPSLPRVAAVAAAFGCAVALHWVFLGVCARRLSRSVAVWVSLSVLLFPVGSAMSLIVLGWFGGAPQPRRAARA